jgi:hypothetical protein
MLDYSYKHLEEILTASQHRPPPPHVSPILDTFPVYLYNWARTHFKVMQELKFIENRARCKVEVIKKLRDRRGYAIM